MGTIARAAAKTTGTYLRRLGCSINASGDQFSTFLDEHPGFFLVWFTLSYCVVSFAAAYHRPLWLDEIITVYISGLPHLHDIWSALLQAVDGNPPLHYLLTRPFIRTLGGTGLPARLPAMLGFWAACVCLFAFLRRRSSTTAAAIAVLVFAQTGAFIWASQARPYAPMLGFVGLALVCWQRYTDGSRRPALWLCGLTMSIASFISTHYYSTLVVIPLLLAEMLRWFAKRRIDWPLCVSVLVGVSPTLLWLPILQSVRNNVASNAFQPDYFARPSLSALYGAYSVLLDSLILPGTVCLAAAALLAKEVPGPPDQARSANPIPMHELALAAGMALLPVIALITASVITKTFHVRYVLSGALGIAMLAGALVDHCFGNRRIIGLALLAVLFFSFWRPVGYLTAGTEQNEAYSPHALLLEEAHAGGPIVVTEGLLFAPLWYYAPAPLRSRLFYLTDLSFAQHRTDTTNENIMLALRPMAPQAIRDLEEFIKSNKDFLLYYFGESANSSLEALLARGCSVSLQSKKGQQLLFNCHCR